MGTDRSALADVLELAEIEKLTWVPGLAALWASGTPVNADDDGEGDDEPGDDDDASDARADGDDGSGDDDASDDDGESDEEIAANGKDPAKVKRTLDKLRARIKPLEGDDASAKTKKKSGKADGGDDASDDDDKAAETLRADRAEVAADTGVPRKILQLVGAKNRSELEKAAEALKVWRDEGPASATDDLDGGAKPRPTTASDPASLAKGVSRGW